MHRFRLHKKNSDLSKTVKVYALMNGTYFGGSDPETEITGIPCTSSTANGKSFRIIVSDDGVMLSSTPTTPITINGVTQATSLTNFEVKHRDRIGIGCCDIFELIERDPSTIKRIESCAPCFHPHNPNDERRAYNRIDCPYSKCLFACWSIADLNEHTRSDDGHKGKRMNESKEICTVFQ